MVILDQEAGEYARLGEGERLEAKLFDSDDNNLGKEVEVSLVREEGFEVIRVAYIPEGVDWAQVR